jgi:hypothetical protein
MFNSSQTVVEDVALHAAPYMAITSFNGEGGHTLRRVRFEPNEPGQLLVAEKDGIHESDVRRGITVEDSTVGFLNDDFFNVYSPPRDSDHHDFVLALLGPKQYFNIP